MIIFIMITNITIIIFLFVGSSGFDSAIADVKQYFPSGLFGNLSSVLTDYQVNDVYNTDPCNNYDNSCLHVIKWTWFNTQ